MSPIEQVLDLARWAPSGDNTQPWRFEITGERTCVIHGFDTREHCVYDLTGGPSQISVGALLETARIAATGLRMRAHIARRPDSPDTHALFDVRLEDDPSVSPSDLIPHIETRCTHRRPYSRRALTAAEKAALAESVGTFYTLRWFEGRQRWELAKLLFRSARIRLTIREAYQVHASVIQWHSQFSESRIPDEAVGLDLVGLALMRWAMKRWRRAEILSKYLGGTLLPRLQLDLLPALGCAAHLFIVAPRALQGIDDHLAVGGAVQRLWLTAARLGLALQPELTPLIFGRYARDGIAFTTDAAARRRAADVAEALERLLGADDARRAAWVCRIGAAAPPRARSLRRPLADLRLPANP
jgi:hypothetical protein